MNIPLRSEKFQEEIRSISLHNRASHLFFVLIILFVSGCKTTPVEFDKPTQDGLFTVFQLRESSDYYVRLAKSRLKDNELKAAQDKYLSLKSKGNSYLKLVNLGLTSASEPDLKDQIKEVAEAYSSFKQTVERDKGFAPTADVVAGLIKGLTEAGIDIWKAKNTHRDDQIKQLKDEITKAEWQEWEKIK